MSAYQNEPVGLKICKTSGDSMRAISAFATICVATVVSGCVAAQNPSGTYLGMVGNCPSRMGDARQEVRKSWADLMRVPVSSVPKYFCNRLNGAMKAGKISESEYQAVFGSGMVSPRIYRVLRGDKGLGRLP